MINVELVKVGLTVLLPTLLTGGGGGGGFYTPLLRLHFLFTFLLIVNQLEENADNFVGTPISFTLLVFDFEI